MFLFKKGILKIIIIALILSMLFIAGCNNANDNNNNNNNDNSNGDDTLNISDEASLSETTPIYNNDMDKLILELDLDEEDIEMFSGPDDYEELPDTNYTKLHNAFNIGEINEEEYSKLLILTKFQPESIQSEYVGAEGSESIDYAYQYLADNWDDLSPETREAIKPYMLPLSDPESYFNQNDFSGEVCNNGFSLCSTVSAAGTTYQTVYITFTIDGIEVTICYNEYDNWSDDKKLEYDMCLNDIEDAIRISYPKYEKLLTVSLTKKLLIELVPLERYTYGEAWFQNGSYRIRLATANYKDVIKTQATAAHELFHNFQYEMGLRFRGTDTKWLHEATAKWAEHYVFDAYNTEHGYLYYFFSTLDRDRINFGHNFEYCGYMLFYYFSDYGEYNIVPEILWDTVRNGESGIRKYLSDSISNMRDQYADYAFNNVNMGVLKKYYDYGNLIGRPTGEAYYKWIMAVDEVEEQDVILKPGAIQYYLYLFDTDDEIKHVDFEFDKTFENDKYIKRQVAIKIDGKWNFEDWSALESDSYCKLSEMRNEKIEQILIIYSNSNFKKDSTPVVDSFKITTGKCPAEMKINITAETTYSADGFSWKSTATINETVKIIEHCFFAVKSSDYSFDGSGMTEGRSLISTNGSSNTQISEPSIDNSMIRLILPMDSRLKDFKEQLEAFGLDENTPKGGILVTVPSLSDEGSLSGSTKMYFPEPMGTINFDDPLPFDGLSQLVAVEIPYEDWNSNGFSTELEIDYFSHDCPLLSWFEVDYSKLEGMMSSIDGFEMPDTPDLQQQLDDLGISSEDFGDLMPGMEDVLGGDNQLTESISAFQNMANLMSGNVSTGSFTVKLKITGEYTKFN